MRAGQAPQLVRDLHAAGALRIDSSVASAATEPRSPSDALAFAALLLLGGVIALWYFRSGSSREPGQPKRGVRLWQWLKSLVSYRRCEPAEARRMYRALLRWGRRSGVPARASETPLEYGQRLQQRLGAPPGAIAEIVNTFNIHTYSNEPPAAGALAPARRALSRLHSPRLWFRRARSWWRA